MNKNSVLARAICVSLGVVMAASLAACAKGGSQGQATNQPANLALTTSAASQLPPEGGGTMPDGTQAPEQAGANPQQAGANAQPEFAQVVAVTPLKQSTTTSSPRQVCQDEQVQVPETYKDKHQIGGAVVGGLVGALVGNQVGGGKGKKVATLGGAAAGAFAGHEIQKNHQEKNATKTETQNVCKTVTDKTTKTTTAGYDVTYTLNGKTGHVRMDHNPGIGTGLPVQNGEVVAGDAKSSGYYR